MRRRDFVSTTVLIFALATPIVLAQLWASARNATYVEGVIAKFEQMDRSRLDDEKLRQEVASLRIENETRSFFWHSLWTSLGPILTALVTLSGGLFGLRKYLDARTKERLDRAAGDLKNDLEYLVSDDGWKKTIGVVGLQHYFAEDKSEYHVRALSALVTAARWADRPDLQQAVRLAAEQAVRQLPVEALRSVSWQHSRLRNANFAGADLSGVDFRDADLENANLSGCDLSGAQFSAACLKGADVRRARLVGGSLAYADFAGADLSEADLSGAEFHHVKVLRANLARADLRSCRFEPDEVPWELTRNWRSAQLPEGVRADLLRRLGPELGGIRVLLLSWEVPPIVAGGTWTATYHFVRNLRRLGVAVTVAVPWEEASVRTDAFGCEVEMIPLGIRLPDFTTGPYAVGSPYGSSPYGSSPYGTSPYGTAAYGVYGRSGPASYGSSRGGIRGGSSALSMARDFRRRLLRLVRHRAFDLVHAQDWITFDAAEAAATRLGVPWVAHFHSLERDRRPDEPDAVIARIESGAAERSSHNVVPSRRTAQHLSDAYGVSMERIGVVPNVLSREEVTAEECGRFESKRVVFLGRLTRQKGADLIPRLADLVGRSAGATFVVFGAGELEGALQWAPYVWYRGFLPWERRSDAFADATAVVVPSRSEPFGMVVLEAMQHGVPVVYSKHSGAAEVVRSGVQVDPEDVEGMARALSRLLTDWEHWEDVVSRQLDEVSSYHERGHEQALMRAWKDLAGPAEPA